MMAQFGVVPDAAVDLEQEWDHRCVEQELGRKMINIPLVLSCMLQLIPTILNKNSTIHCH